MSEFKMRQFVQSVVRSSYPRRITFSSTTRGIIASGVAITTVKTKQRRNLPMKINLPNNLEGSESDVFE